MAKTKENHRNKKKSPRTHEELDLTKFNDMVKHKVRHKENRTLADKEGFKRKNHPYKKPNGKYDKDYKQHDKSPEKQEKQENKQGYKKHKPYKPKQS